VRCDFKPFYIIQNPLYNNMHSALDNLVVKETNIQDDYDFVEVLSQGDFSTVAKAVRRKDN